jgi:hypothetical protein
MTLSLEEKIELSNYRMEKAKKILSDAELLFESGSYESAANRAYYAMFSAVKSLLILRGIDPETHEGAKTMFSKEFIRTGILGKEYGEYFRNLQSRRLDSDYGDYVDIGNEEAGDSVKKARRFIEVADQYRIKVISGVK